ncbi:MAG: hypothetical protein GX446_08640 [Chthonomonadales bacterium]|nr:hypothetical protein [Chthonomonadales bacterium]
MNTRTRRKPARLARFCVMMPKRLTERLDDAVAEGFGTSRADVIRRACELHLKTLDLPPARGGAPTIEQA